MIGNTANAHHFGTEITADRGKRASVAVRLNQAKARDLSC